MQSGEKWGYSSGQVGRCLQSGNLVSDETVAQSDLALAHLKSVAEANGFTLEDTLKTTVFLVDVNDMKAVNEVYASYFSSSEPPARSTVTVKDLPLGAKMEIEAVFFKGAE